MWNLVLIVKKMQSLKKRLLRIILCALGRLNVIFVTLWQRISLVLRYISIKKHSAAIFNCFTCNFTCETHSELVEHNDIYYYSHRITLNKEYEKEILDEFQRLDEDGFLIHRKLDWWGLFFQFWCVCYGDIPR